jgi:hypothetical protein
MSEFLAKFSGGELIGFVAVVGGLLVAVISVVATQWRKVRVTEMEATLKQQMLDKGMTAAEIEQVMRAGHKSDDATCSTGDAALDRTALAKRMIDNGYEGEDIERVLKAYQPGAKQNLEKSFVKQA